MMRALAAIAIGLWAGCSSDQYLVVTVNARPAVHDAKTLAITLGNGGATLTKQLTLGAHAFPVKFSIDAPGRTGELDVTVEADDDMALPVGIGSGSATIGAGDAAIELDSTDFTVNTDYAMDQFLSFDYDSDGLQISAAPDGSWMVGFRDNCNGSGMCNVFGRKFEVNGAPSHTAAAAGTNAFQLTTTLTDGFTDPAMVTSGMQTIALWNYTDTVGMGHGVGCRTIDPTGDAGTGQLSLSTDTASIVSAAAFSNGNLAVVWELGYGIPPSAQIRAIIAKPDCTTLATNPATVSTAVGMTSGPTSPHVATNGSNSMFAWIVDGDVYVRAANSTGNFAAAESKILTHSTTQSAGSVRLAASGTGYALIVRWVHPTSSTAPGKIEMFQLTTAGTLMGSPALITDQSRSDFASGLQSTSVAVRGDGGILVAWHQCDASGSTDTCDVYGRMVRPNGTTSGQPFILSSSTAGDQTQPSVAALPGPDNAFAAVWTDTSHAAPDTSGSAVHGRIIYPSYDPNGSN
jgi:hypothetical protein